MCVFETNVTNFLCLCENCKIKWFQLTSEYLRHLFFLFPYLSIPHFCLRKFPTQSLLLKRLLFLLSRSYLKFSTPPTTPGLAMARLHPYPWLLSLWIGGSSWKKIHDLPILVVAITLSSFGKTMYTSGLGAGGVNEIRASNPSTSTFLHRW